MKKRLLIALVALMGVIVVADACTSAIVSGKLTANGRPLMWKNRDTNDLNNRVERIVAHDGLMEFVALFDARDLQDTAAWMGFNEAGFAIMNTATYDLKDDDVPAGEMDCEGVLMYRALEICETLADFEHFLDTLSRPLRVEANFGVIDEKGGAAYYEVNNSRWVKFDVNTDPLGYRVVTNFTLTGRPEDRRGVDRYRKAHKILASTDIPPCDWDHKFFLRELSCSGAPILRDISSSAVTFEKDTMWVSLGKPNIVPCLPYRLD